MCEWLLYQLRQATAGEIHHTLTTHKHKTDWILLKHKSALLWKDESTMKTQCLLWVKPLTMLRLLTRQPLQENASFLAARESRKGNYREQQSFDWNPYINVLEVKGLRLLKNKKNATGLNLYTSTFSSNDLLYSHSSFL